VSPTPPKRRSIFASKLGAFADFASDDAAAFERHGRWRAYFRERIGDRFNGRIIFEIGCADAASLCSMAAKHPTTGFIGLDWKYKQIFVGAKQAASQELRNVTLLRARAQDIRQIFADGEVDEMLVFHPEPCDRPEETANRLLAPPFLFDVHRVLRDGGSTLSLKTDHIGYYKWMLGQLGLPEPAWSASRPTTVRTRDILPRDQVPVANSAITDRFTVTVNSNDFWNDKAALAHTATRCFAGEVTMFERRFMTKRQPIFYLELQKRIQTERASTSR
jgi:tRNA G46 methylase TrmB